MKISVITVCLNSGEKLSATLDSILGQPGKHIINTPYIDAIFAAGGTPVLVPVGGGPERARDYTGILDGLLLPGGEDVTPNLYGEEPRPQVTYMNEDRDRMEMELLALALERRLPVFGICRGMQLVAAALGGALYQDLPTQRPGSVAHSQDRSIRAQLAGRFSSSQSRKLSTGSDAASALKWLPPRPRRGTPRWRRSSPRGSGTG